MVGSGVARSPRPSLGQHSRRAVGPLRFESQAHIHRDHEPSVAFLQKAIISLVGPQLWRWLPTGLATASTSPFCRILSPPKATVVAYYGTVVDVEQRCLLLLPPPLLLLHTVPYGRLSPLYSTCRGAAEGDYCAFGPCPRPNKSSSVYQYGTRHAR